MPKPRRSASEAYDLAEKHALVPLEPFPGWWQGWRCRCTNCDGVSRPRFGRLANGDVGPCQTCGIRAAVARFVDPAEREAQMRAHGYDPLEPYPGASTNWTCQHACGSVVNARYDTVMAGAGCCWECGRSKRQLDPKQAETVLLAAGYVPLEPFPGTWEKWKCRHEPCGRVVQAVYRRVQGGQECCRSCGRVKAAATSRHDHATAAGAMLGAGLEPLVLYPGHRKPWPCRCMTCGRDSSPTRAHITAGHGCRWCSLRESGARQRAARAEEAMAVMRAAGLDPQEAYPGASRPWHCQCQRCGRDVWPRLSTVRQGSKGCIDCGIELTIAKQRENPEKAAADMRAAGYEPLEPYDRSGTPWRCVHTLCGKEIRISLNAVRQRNGGCAHCAKRGFSLSKPAYIYVLNHPGNRAVKSGITNVGTRRITGFRNRGWETVGEPLRLATGEKARAIETAVLDHIANVLGLRPFLDRAAMGYLGGQSETFDAMKLPPLALHALVVAMADALGAE